MKRQLQQLCIWGMAVLVLAILLTAQHAGKAKMKGVVTDEQGQPLEKVKIKLFSENGQSGFEVESEKDGSWKAFWIRGGVWDIDFIKIGFEPKRISISLDESGKMFDVPIRLKKMQGVMLTKELMDELEKGNQLFNQQKYDEALAVFIKMITENPEAYIIHMNIGNCHFEKKEYDQAIASFMKVLETEKDHIKAVISIANSYSNKGDQEKALEWYGKLSLDKIDDADAIFNIGVNFLNKGDMAASITYFKRSVELKPEFLEGWFQLGVAYTAVSNYPEAKAAFENYLKYDPNSERAAQVREIMKSLK